MKKLLIIIAVLALASAKSIESSEVQPIESIGIEWSQVQPIEDSDQYWARLPEEMQYLRKQQPDKRIVNGQEAAPGQFPYQVFVTYMEKGKSFNCGGSILSPTMILTAAHCVWRAESGTVIAGVHNRNINEPTQQRSAFAKVYYHADYNENNFENDIAIIRLSSPITFNTNVQPVRLPARGDNRQFNGMTGTVSGFGALCSGCSAPDVLRYTTNPILSNADCLVHWGPSNVKDSSLCVSVVGERGACQGDSGGPLTVKDGENTLQVGVVSFGRACVDVYPSVYARVTYYLDWILHVMTL